jgi:hypothetical protein
MNGLRRLLKHFVFAWLVCQSASLLALAPVSCCAAHEVPAEAAECHGGADGSCPMHAGTGDDCPLHASTADAEPSCVMRGVCNGPATLLAALIPMPAVLATEASVVAAESRATIASRVEHPLELSRSIESPPPRL